MDHLYTTSQVSNITRKIKFSHIIDMISKINFKKCENRKPRILKIALISL